MYVLELDADERTYLMSLLNRQRTMTAKTLGARLKSAGDVFGVVMWSDDDIVSLLRKHNLPASRKNIEAVRESHYGRHIGDHMVERGWEVLEEAV